MADATNLKVDYMLSQGTGAKGEPIRGNQFEVHIADLHNEVHLMAQTITLPSMTMAQGEINHFNEKSKIANGPVEYDNVSLEILDTVDPDTAKSVYEWFTKVYDPETGEVGYASDYKKEGAVFQFDSKGKKVREWKLTGIWPTNINYGQADYAGTEPIRIVLDLSVDRIEMVGVSSSSGE